MDDRKIFEDDIPEPGIPFGGRENLTILMELPEEEADADVTAGASFTLHGNFKIFARAILALNRVGNDLYMEPSNFGLALRSLSCSKSAFGTFMFSKSFFSECDVSRLDSNTHNVCRIPMKVVLCVVSLQMCKNSEKAVLSCQFYLNPQADTMLIQFTHTYDVVRNHKISFFECATMFRTVVDKTNLNNCFVIQARLLLEMFNRMHHNTDEILIDAKIEEISFKNYITHEQDRDMIMKTEGKIPVAEFQKYSVQQPAEITVNLKELKAIVNFADVHQSFVSIYFDQPGIPIVIALEDDVNYTAEVTLATAVDDPAGYDVNPEVPIEIVHVPMDERQSKRKRSQFSSNLHFSRNLVEDCVMTIKRITEASNVRNNDAKEPLNGMENTNFVTGPPHATSSPIRAYRPFKGIHQLFLEKLVITQINFGNVMDIRNNVTETSRTNADVNGAGNLDQRVRLPELFCYLFSTDEPTFDSMELEHDTEVLASDSASKLQIRTLKMSLTLTKNTIFNCTLCRIGMKNRTGTTDLKANDGNNHESSNPFPTRRISLAFNGTVFAVDDVTPIVYKQYEHVEVIQQHMFLHYCHHCCHLFCLYIGIGQEGKKRGNREKNVCDVSLPAVAPEGFNKRIFHFYIRCISNGKGRVCERFSKAIELKVLEQKCPKQSSEVQVTTSVMTDRI
ncbi:BMA-HPR-9, isoform b [Dirofilaria immitis]|nr:BMA-HPR-9, isoform b [Dirofilaria immitis]